MQDARPTRSRGIGFVIVCIVVVGAALYLNAGFNGQIASLRADFEARFKALSEETTGVKPEIETNRGALKRLETGLVSLESRVQSVSAIATQMHDMLFKQLGMQEDRDATLNDLVAASRELQRQLAVLLGNVQEQSEQAGE